MTNPRVVVSKCLGFEACRYNREIIVVDWLEDLQSKADIVPVCPEALAGLIVPRNPINLYKKDNHVHVIQDKTGFDVTEALEQASDVFLSTIGEVDAFILKSRSPSCGLGTTKIRLDDSFYFASGVFATKAMEAYGKTVFIDETELAKEGVEAFLKRV